MNMSRIRTLTFVFAVLTFALAQAEDRTKNPNGVVLSVISADVPGTMVSASYMHQFLPWLRLSVGAGPYIDNSKIFLIGAAAKIYFLSDWLISPALGIGASYLDNSDYSGLAPALQATLDLQTSNGLFLSGGFTYFEAAWILPTASVGWFW